MNFTFRALLGIRGSSHDCPSLVLWTLASTINHFRVLLLHVEVETLLIRVALEENPFFGAVLCFFPCRPIDESIDSECHIFSS